VPPVLNVVILPQVVNPQLLTGGHFILYDTNPVSYPKMRKGRLEKSKKACPKTARGFSKNPIEL
jgi:hypothetical protein